MDELEKIKSHLEIREKEVFALFCYYHDKGAEIDKLQKHVDTVCQSMTKAFFASYKDQLEKPETKRELLKYLNQIGANMPYSGKRLSHCVYQALTSKTDEITL